MRDVVAVADFGAHSSQRRFHLINLPERQVSSFLVAHGRGSDPEHSGLLQFFSNEVDSNASSEGAYRTGEFYVGKYGRSLRLDGLDRSNSNALARAIVVHAADYVSEAVVAREGKSGLSEGCFAFDEDDAELIMRTLGQDRLLLSGRFLS
nr:murein L,D-transpeptidase catalytic domain family protein [Variovorax dokdonensis]